MLAVRMDTLGNAGPIGAEASSFHALMAARMERDGVLRRLPDGGYLVAVREADLHAIDGLRSGAAGRIDLRPCDGVHLAEIEVFADVLDAEMRCTLLSFPPDFMAKPDCEPTARAASAPARGPEAAGSARPGDAVGGPAIDALMDDLERALAVDPTVPHAADLAAQIARDLPEIERILRRAGVGG